jgi:hypothetical protein
MRLTLERFARRGGLRFSPPVERSRYSFVDFVADSSRVILVADLATPHDPSPV